MWQTGKTICKALWLKTPQPLAKLVTPNLLPFWHMCSELRLPVVLKDGAPAEVARLLRNVPGIKLVLSHFAGCFGADSDYRSRLELAASQEDVTIATGALTYRQTCLFSQAQESEK
ncbi:MAG: amidohydrolase family protein [Anaerolineae bacterium]